MLAEDHGSIEFKLMYSVIIRSLPAPVPDVKTFTPGTLLLL